MNSIKEIVQNYITRKFYRQGVYKMLCLFQRTGSWDIMMKRRDAMQKKLFAEVEGNYVRPFCSIPKYAIVTLQIYKLDTDEILFENHCPHERLPERFAEGVEEGVRFFASENNIQGIQVELLDGGWHESDSHQRDFMLAAMLALVKVFPK